jgi:hypothetical protein
VLDAAVIMGTLGGVATSCTGLFLFVGTLRDRPGMALFVAFGLALLFTMGGPGRLPDRNAARQPRLRDQANSADEVGEAHSESAPLVDPAGVGPAPRSVSGPMPNEASLPPKWPRLKSGFGADHASRRFRLVQPCSLELFVDVPEFAAYGLGDLSHAHSLFAQGDNARAIEGHRAALVNALRLCGVDAARGRSRMKPSSISATMPSTVRAMRPIGPPVSMAGSSTLGRSRLRAQQQGQPASM